MNVGVSLSLSFLGGGKASRTTSLGERRKIQLRGRAERKWMTNSFQMIFLHSAYNFIEISSLRVWGYLPFWRDFSASLRVPDWSVRS